jgi:hypothetical protein
MKRNLNKLRRVVFRKKCEMKNSESWNVIEIIGKFNSSRSAVGIATEYGLDDRGVGVRIPESSRIKNFLFSTSSRPALGSTHPPIQ